MSTALQTTEINDCDLDEVKTITVNRKGVPVLSVKADVLYVLWRECLAAANTNNDGGVTRIDLEGIYTRYQEAILNTYGVQLTLFAIANIAASVTAQMNELKKNSLNEQEPPATGSNTES